MFKKPRLSMATAETCPRTSGGISTKLRVQSSAATRTGGAGPVGMETDEVVGCTVTLVIGGVV